MTHKIWTILDEPFKTRLFITRVAFTSHPARISLSSILGSDAKIGQKISKTRYSKKKNQFLALRIEMGDFRKNNYNEPNHCI